MQSLLVVAVLFAGIGGSYQQVQAQVCPSNTASDFWTDESVSGLGFLSGATYGGNAEITGTLTVDVTVWNLSGANLRMMGGSRIVVNPACTLRILDGSVLTALQFLWEGVEVLPGAHLEVVNSSICGARNAILADNAFSLTPSSLDIRGSQLVRNQTGVRMKDYTAGPYPFFMASTQILGGLLPSGASTLRSSRGVYGSHLGSLAGPGIVLGDPFSGMNLFSDLDMGIELIQTWADVYNNRFVGMQDVNGLGEGWGIWAERSGPADLVLRVGAVGSGFGNAFEGCRYGVSCNSYNTFEVINNTFGSGALSFELGVRAQGMIGALVQGNTMQGFSGLGIFLDDMPGTGGMGAAAQIINNQLEGSLGTSQGILADELSGSLDVRGNVITEVFRGIGLQNVSTQPLVRLNSISFAYPGSGVTTDPAAGIYLFQTEQAEVLQNDLYGNCPFPFGGGPCTTGTTANRRIRGIQLTNTLNSLVESNILRDCGAGLVINGNNNEGNALCNRFIDNYTGLLWDAMPSGAFGITFGGGPPRVAPAFHEWSDNRWESSLSGFLSIRSWSINSADAFSVRWFHRDLPVEYDLPLGLMFEILPSTIPNALIGTHTDYCFDDTPEPPGQASNLSASGFEGYWDSELAALLSGSGTMSGGLYAHLRAAHRTGSATAQEQSAMATTAIAGLDVLRNLLRSDTVASLAWLDEVHAFHEQEVLLLEVFSIKARGKVAAQTADEGLDWQPYLTEVDWDRLAAIGEMDPAAHGEAVLWAQSYLNRSLLRDTWLEEEITERRAIPLEHPSLFPNPSSGALYVTLPWQAEQIVIYDIQGRNVLSSYPGAAKEVVINLGVLPDGLYILKAISPTGAQWSERFVYQKR